MNTDAERPHARWQGKEVPSQYGVSHADESARVAYKRTNRGELEADFTDKEILTNLDRSLDVLKAISGDQAYFKIVYNRLQRYADSVALALFADSVIRQEAVQQALDYTVEKLRNASSLIVNARKPENYVKRMVFNKLIDCSRLRGSYRKNKDEEFKPGKVEFGKGWDVPGQDVCARTLGGEIIFNPMKVTKSEDDEDSGWRKFNIDESLLKGDKKKERTIELGGRELDKDFLVYALGSWYVEQLNYHPWIKTLENILRYEWWTPESVSELDYKDVNFIFRENTKKIWSKYNLITGLIDNITSPSEKRVVLRYLWGFKAVDIAWELNIDKSYISRILKKWTEEWGWNEDDISQSRLILLTKYLADWYRGYCSVPKLRRKEMHENSAEYKAGISYIDNHKKECFHSIIISPQTRAYFHDLDLSEINSLNVSDLPSLTKLTVIAECFHNIWYPDVRLLRY